MRISPNVSRQVAVPPRVDGGPTVAEKLVAQLDKQRRLVDFDTYDIIVQQLITMVESGTIDIAPVYQRKFRWDDRKRSQLIESIFLGVPVPSLFMATNRDGTWEVVDGVQRLSTVVQFAGPPQARLRIGLSTPLQLNSLDKLDAFNGLEFSDLPNSLKFQFLHRPLKVITLSDKSDLVVRFDLFERLNTGGVALTNQEIRGCIFRGQFSDFMERLGQSEDFRGVVRLTQRQEEDGTREECVLRFFAFLNSYKRFVHSVEGFLTEFMRDATKSFDYDGGERLFRETFRQLRGALPNGIVRKESRKISPINLFEAVSVGAALAIQKKGKISASGAKVWIESGELRVMTTGATNTTKRVSGRIEYCRDRFLGK